MRSIDTINEELKRTAEKREDIAKSKAEISGEIGALEAKFLNDEMTAEEVQDERFKLESKRGTIDSLMATLDRRETELQAELRSVQYGANEAQKLQSLKKAVTRGEREYDEFYRVLGELESMITVMAEQLFERRWSYGIAKGEVRNLLQELGLDEATLKARLREIGLSRDALLRVESRLIMQRDSPWREHIALIEGSYKRYREKAERKQRSARAGGVRQ